MLFRKKAQAAPSIKLMKEYVGQPENTWQGSGVLFQVCGGKGFLHQAYGTYHQKGLHSLMFGEVPLIRFHGDEYFCPTCEKLISAGYGLDKTQSTLIEDLRGALNGPFVSLTQSLQDLAPLLGLLPSGFYGLADMELYPTDGDGHFFWAVDNTPRLNPATCPMYDSGNWAEESPAFVLPTQPPSRFNPQRAEYYRENPQCRAVAYNIGSLNILLDGHHKATAAALEGRKLKTLVIFPSIGISYSYQNQQDAKLTIGSEMLYLKDLGISIEEARQQVLGGQMAEPETKRCLFLTEKSFDEYRWPQYLLSTAQKYPTAYSMACMEWAGGVSEERIAGIIAGQEILDNDQMEYLCTALHFLEKSRFCQLAFQVGKNDRYAPVWHSVFRLLSTIRSESVESFFIEHLINDDGSRPEATKIADDYLNSGGSHG